MDPQLPDFDADKDQMKNHAANTIRRGVADVEKKTLENIDAGAKTIAARGKDLVKSAASAIQSRPFISAAAVLLIAGGFLARFLLRRG